MVGDLHQRHGHGLQRSARLYDRVVRCQGLEEVRSRNEGQVGDLGDLGRGLPSEVAMRVEPGADRGSAERPCPRTALAVIGLAGPGLACALSTAGGAVASPAPA